MYNILQKEGDIKYYGHIFVQLFCVAMGFLELSEPFNKMIPVKLEATVVSILMLDNVPGIAVL
jgi:hypothetical protein